MEPQTNRKWGGALTACLLAFAVSMLSYVAYNYGKDCAVRDNTTSQQELPGLK